MPWIRKMFKGCKVYVLCDEQEQPVVNKGLVDIKYQPDDSRIYHAHHRSIEPIDETKPKNKENTAPTSKKENTKSEDTSIKKENDSEAIIIYTDGACSGNPGPAGVGIVMVYKEHRKEISKSIGLATNNIAELMAIKLGLEAVKDRFIPIHLYTDSAYSYGILSNSKWKAHENKELVFEIREMMKDFPELRLFKVRGHVGESENERADKLARLAISEESSRQTP